MDISSMIIQLKNNLTPFNIALFVLLVVSEILGSNASIKANSIYGLFRVMLLTLKDQVWPSTVVTTTVTTQTAIPAGPTVAPSNPQ